jgi:hypothetical protein
MYRNLRELRPTASVASDAPRLQLVSTALACAETRRVLAEARAWRLNNPSLGRGVR